VQLVNEIGMVIFVQVGYIYINVSSM